MAKEKITVNGKKLTELTIKETLGYLKKKEFSALELICEHIKKTEAEDQMNCFITKTFDLALEKAKESDDNIAKGQMKSLEAIPIGVKDLFCTKNIKTTAASRMLHNFVPAYESSVTQKIFAENAIMIGKTNMDSFAMGSANSFSDYGQVINPWKNAETPEVDLVPGGSSGGSAASVASGSVMAALGSDTGGSIRQPAAFCGIVGIKPSYGRCSRYGMVPFASSLDQAGIFARNVEDAALIIEKISGYDEKDSTCVNLPVPDLSKNILDGKKMRVAIPKEYDLPNIPQEIKSWWVKAASWFEEEGHEIIEISLPHTEYGLPVYYVIAPAEASSNLARYDGVKFGHRCEAFANMTLDDMYKISRSEGFGEEIKRRIMIGTSVLFSSQYDAFYRRAQAVRHVIMKDFDLAFEKADIILTPTTPTEAFAVGYKEDDPTVAYLNDVFTVSANLAGLPGMSVPIGLSKNKLPLGIQIMSKRFDEASMIKAGYFLEAKANFNFSPEKSI